jgi:hypothetical protein
MANDLQLISDSFKQYIVTPLNAFGVGGFVFDNEGDTTLNLSADITDHYTEDNKSVQDHIAIKPKRVTLKGYVGELVYRDGNTDGGTIQKVTQKLTVVSSFLPTLSAAATQATALIKSAREGNLSLGNVSLESVNKVLDLWGLAKNLAPSATRQMQAYMYFKALYEQKILCSLQTPYEFLSNMAIESIIAVQPENTKFISDFTITLKQIRTVDVLSKVATTQGRGVSDSPTPIAQGRNVQQSAPVSQIGNMPGLDTSKVSVQDIASQLNNNTTIVVKTAEDLMKNPDFVRKVVIIGGE